MYGILRYFNVAGASNSGKIGEIENNSVKPIPENFSKFENLIKDFATHIGQTIKSSKKLAEMMAGKARLLQDILERAITSDDETQENTSLKGQYDTFKQILIHDLKPKDFATLDAIDPLPEADVPSNVIIIFLTITYL